MRSLAAFSGRNDVEFFTRLFREQDPQRFALLVLDQRCLKKPLLEALISDLRILADLQLTPVMLIGALDEDRSSVKINATRLMKSLERASIKSVKLNCATYGLTDEITKRAKGGAMVVLEMTERRGSPDLKVIVENLQPGKVIFLQPSGGLRRDGERLAVLPLAEIEKGVSVDHVSPGQALFLHAVSQLAEDAKHSANYIIASPLNMLQELFTVKGSGTLVRRSAVIRSSQSYRGKSKTRIKASIEEAFGRELREDFFDRPVSRIFIEEDYRGGAIFTPLSGLPYLSKFWVARAAQGEGLARDVWDAARAKVPAFFWRSRRSNPFNEWYMQACDGMQISGEWRVFWVGLNAPEIPSAILAAANAPHDFSYDNLFV